MLAEGGLGGLGPRVGGGGGLGGMMVEVLGGVSFCLRKCGDGGAWVPGWGGAWA